MSSEIEVSGSIEMYLATIAVLQANEQPVPLSHLADHLSHSPVSVNEMCRKLADNRGLIEYEPYKGVTLTAKGAMLAQHVLRRRRLWEVFLVEKLSIEPNGAEVMACRFEHVTPEELAERLATFLGHPTLSPQNKPIPPGTNSGTEHPLRPLTTLTAGQRGQIVNIIADGVSKDFLRHQGLSPGVVVEVLAVTSDGPILLGISGHSLSLARVMAGNIDVIPVTQ